MGRFYVAGYREKGKRIMPDISMCASTHCPKVGSCYRVTATPTPLRQAYTAFEYGPDGCEFYILEESE